MFLKTASLLCQIFLLMITGALGNEWSVTYSVEHLCALKGSTVFMNGSYTHPTGLTVTETYWVLRPNQSKDPSDLRNEPGFSGRVEYLDKQKHFSFRLSDVNETDNLIYHFRIKTNKENERWIQIPGVRLNVTGVSVIVYVSVGVGLFGLAALLSALFWLRWKRQKKKADEGDDQNAGPSAKDDTYAALDPTGRTSDDVYHTLT
ncbi:B-cell receptor CD22-like, partial [Clarias magur]